MKEYQDAKKSYEQMEKAYAKDLKAYKKLKDQRPKVLDPKDPLAIIDLIIWEKESHDQYLELVKKYNNYVKNYNAYVDAWNNALAEFCPTFQKEGVAGPPPSVPRPTPPLWPDQPFKAKPDVPIGGPDYIPEKGTHITTITPYGPGPFHRIRRLFPMDAR